MSKLLYSVCQLIVHSIDIFIDFLSFIESVNCPKAIELWGLLTDGVIFLERWELEKHTYTQSKRRKRRQLGEAEDKKETKKPKGKRALSFDQSLALV